MALLFFKVGYQNSSFIAVYTREDKKLSQIFFHVEIKSWIARKLKLKKNKLTAIALIKANFSFTGPICAAR